MSIDEDRIDPDAKKIVARLTRHGYSAYLVGGCVRDLLLDRKPKDVDIATSAEPQEVKALFRNCRIIGRRFRLAHIFFGQKIIETATFRATPRQGEVEAEVESEEADPSERVTDGHEPANPNATVDPGHAELLIKHDNVFGTAEEDARRRDFTVNGLFYDLNSHEVIDYVDGLRDLEARTIRTIGDPDIRFREDPIRMLRAIKFAARLDFQIDAATYQALLQHRAEIKKSAPPRVLEEIYRLLRGGAARRSLELLAETGIEEHLLPTLAGRLAGSDDAKARFERALAAIDKLVADGRTPSNGFLVAALDGVFELDLLYGPELPPTHGQPRLDLVREVFDRTQPLYSAMRVARRDAERARQMLVAQRRLLPTKRRRSRPMSLVRRDWFHEALLLFEILHPMVAEGTAEILQRWRRLEAGEEDGEGGGATAASAAATTPAPEGSEPAGNGDRPRRRRRRGGRGRRKAPRPDGSDLGSPPPQTGA